MTDIKKIINTQKISRLTYFVNTKNFCPLGQADYTNKFSVTIAVGHTMADFCEIQKEIDEKISGKDLIIEDAMKLIGEITRKYYADAFEIAVTSTVDDAAHFKVELVAHY